MARAGLQWGLRELAARAGVGRATVHRFETGRRVPAPAITAAIRQVFEDAGAEFIEGRGVCFEEGEADDSA